MLNTKPSTIDSKLKYYGNNGLVLPSIPLKPLIPFKNLKQRYQIVGTLGHGSFGEVSLAKIKSNQLANIMNEMNLYPNTLMEPLKSVNRVKYDVVAIKTMKEILKNYENYSKVKEAKFILSIKSHPNLIQIYDIFIDSINLSLNIVMEVMDQNLYQLMKFRKNYLFSSNSIRCILSQILAGLRHIHRNLYYHRDVKPENILIMKISNFYGGSKDNIPLNKRHLTYIVKLADYGLAREIKNVKPFTEYVSTRWYRSPEILLRQSFYSYPIDIWAFGCVIVEVVSFSPLFPGINELDQIYKILEILGCPYTENEENRFKNGVEPLGGYWEDGKRLSNKLGFDLPSLPGLIVEELITRTDLPYNDLQNLLKMIKLCLTWDPNKRINVYSLCSMEYFDNSVIREEDHSLDRNMLTKQSQILAGIINEEPSTNLTLCSENSSMLNNNNGLSNKDSKNKELLLNSNSGYKQSLMNDENYHETIHKLRKTPNFNVSMFKFIKSKVSNNKINKSNGVENEQESYKEVNNEEYPNYSVKENEMITPTPQQEDEQQLDQIQETEPEPDWEYDDDIESDYFEEEEEDEEDQDGERLNYSSPLYISNTYKLIQLEEALEEVEKLNNSNNSFNSQICIVNNEDELNQHHLHHQPHSNNIIDSINYALDEEMNYHDGDLYEWNNMP